MSHKNLLQLLGLTLVMVLLVGCGNSLATIEPTSTPTLISPTHTLEPPTATLTPLPPTDTPTLEPPTTPSTPTPLNETLEQSNEVTFKTPEEAITYYFEGVAQADTDKILQAFAVSEMSEEFRFELQTERMGGAFVPLVSLSPADYRLYVETNKILLSAQILNRVKIFAYSLLSDEETDEGKTLILDAERMKNFVQDVNPERLAELEVQKIGPPNKEIMETPQYQEGAASFAATYGADESTERVALFSFEGSTYYLGFRLLRYGENWKISEQLSPLADTNVTGAPQETTVEAFSAMIGRD
jgi:hypothetical protein